MNYDPKLVTKLATAPTIEPVTLAEAKNHLRIDSGTFADDITTTQSIAPAAHAIAAAYTLVGDGVDVLNSETVVNLNSGTNGAGATVDVKLQESEDDITFTDVTGGAFTQVTTANDNQIFEKAYIGTKQYIRAVATVAVDACAFSVDIVEGALSVQEDDLITAYIVAARRNIEQILNRALITQTWDMVFDEWPATDYFDIPYPPLQSVTSVTYYDVDDSGTAWANTNYLVDTYSEPGRLCLNDSVTWPNTTLRPYNGVITRFIAGYGDAASTVPEEYRLAIKMLVGEFYEHRESTDMKDFRELPYAVQEILALDRVYPI